MKCKYKNNDDVLSKTTKIKRRNNYENKRTNDG